MRAAVHLAAGNHVDSRDLLLENSGLHRAHLRVGDIGRPGSPLPNWGLHLIDVNLVMGDLLDIVGQETKAYTAKGSSK